MLIILKFESLFIAWEKSIENKILYTKKFGTNDEMIIIWNLVVLKIF